MPINSYSQSPYHDDFATTDKNYQRILFQPGRSVQVRELNQLQSLLQDQIAKFGDHVFKDGDRVLNGYTTYDDEIGSIPVTFSVVPTAAQLKALEGVEVYKYHASDANVKALRAKIAGVQSFVNSNITYYRLYLKYAGTDLTNNKTTFEHGDGIVLGGDESTITLSATQYTANTTFATADVNNSGEDPAIYGGFFQDEGVFFVKGSFVHTDSQNFFELKTTSSPLLTGNCVFDIEENIITSGDDASLLDNASGSANENSPGADRYQIKLVLNFIDSADTSVSTDQQRVNLLEIVQDNVILPARTEYSELGKTLAERTSEESGSYILKPFKIDVREYLNENSNRGIYTAQEIVDLNISGGPTDTGAAAIYGRKRYSIDVEPSTAYVQGYRVELEDKQRLVVEKGQESTDLKTVKNNQFTATRGQYIEGCFADIGHGTDISDITFAPDSLFHFKTDSAGTGVTNGTFRIHSIELTGVKTFGTSNANLTAEKATHRIYIYDVRLNSGKKVSDSKSFIFNVNDSTFTNGDIIVVNSSGFELFEGTGTTPNLELYELPADAVNSVTSVEFQVQERVQFASTDTSAGEGNSLIANSQLLLTVTAGSLFSTNPNDYQVHGDNISADDTSGGIVVTRVNITSANTAVLDVTRANGDAYNSAGDTVIYAPVKLTGTSGRRTKTLTAGSKTFNSTKLTKGDVLQLDDVDINTLTSITHSNYSGGSSADIKSLFTLDNGQRDSHYDKGRVIYNGSEHMAAGTIVVSYENWAHSGGSYFVADSYIDGTVTPSESVGISDIPEYNGIKLGNCVDFRRGIIESTIDKTILHNSVVNVNFQQYLPRHDLVVLNQLGDVSIVKGKAADVPQLPNLPKDSIELYRIYKPAFVFDLNDLVVETVDQKVYRMSDIGELEDRIKSLEYYASLSELDKEASSTQIQDGSGERFKNGIITDAFLGHGVGDTQNPAYRIAIDRLESTARPMYLSDNSRWSYVSGMQNSATALTTTWNGNTISETNIHSGKREGAVTLDFIEKVLIDQPYSTEHMSVNPYNVATWSGTLELSPSSDEWKDVNHRPDIVNSVEGNNDALLAQIANNPNVLGTEWNEWSTNWSALPRRGRGLFRWFFGRRRRRRQNSFTRRNGRFVETIRPQIRDGIRTTLRESFDREVTDDRVVDISFIPFIRSRKIFFRGRLLKPNTKFYVYFDDVNITSYANQTTFSSFGGNIAGIGGTDVQRYDGLTTGFGAGGTLTTNASGEITGWIVIPNNDSIRFRTGSRQIRLTNHPQGSKTLETSAAETTYFARGILETRQRTVLSTRQLALERTRVTSRRNLVTSRRVRRDPVAQTFMIGNEPTGIFLSSIDVWFKSKDPNIPIELSIVTVENGIPTQDTVPFSKVIKNPSDVPNISDDSASNRNTNFMFDTPVYLQPGVEYAVVLISNSARWRVWVSRVGGQNVVPSGQVSEKVTKNVNLGVLLKSQNASTWTPDQSADLKFKLNRADFKTDASQTALFTGICPERGEVAYVDISSAGSGYLAGAPTVTIASSGGNNITATAKAYVGKGGILDSIEVLNGGTGYGPGAPTVTITSPDPINIGADTAANTFNFDTTLLPIQRGQHIQFNHNGTTHADFTDGQDLYAAPIDSNGNEVEFGHTFKIYDDLALTTQNTFSNALNAIHTITPQGTATATAKINEWRASTFMNMIQDMVLPEADVNYLMTVRGESSVNAGDQLEYDIIPNETVYTDTRVTHDAVSGSAPAGGSHLDILKLEATLSSVDSRISPIIDMDRLSLVSFDNLINNTTELELSADEGEAAARYITRRVNLKNPADRLNIYFDAMRPDESTEFEVFAKFKTLDTAGQTQDFDTLPWTKINPINSKDVQVSSNFEFNEAQYEHELSGQEFDSFSIKIVFKSSNKAFAPEIKNLRAIATT